VRLVAYVVAAPASRIEPELLTRHMRDTLPAHMVPQHIVALATFPQLPNGKIDQKSLPRPMLDAHVISASAQPRDALERTIAGAMAEVLGMAEVGIDDDFFALGGYSLLAVRL